MTQPASAPEFSAKSLTGWCKAVFKISKPTFSSSFSASTLSKALAALSKVTPPPGTMPSSTAALVASTASLTRSWVSLSSISVAAPTLITATPPESLAKRSWSFSLSKSESVRSSSFLIEAIRAIMLDFCPLPPIIRQLSLSAQTFSARPQSSTVTLSSFRPVSSEITEPPVKIAMSSSIAFLRSPKPGALTAKRLKAPRSLLTTRVARASPSISSAIMTIFLVTLTTPSKNGSRSAIADTFLSVIKITGSSISDSILSGLVTK